MRVAVSAYGLHLFGKVRIPSLPDEGPAYIHFRAFTGGPDDQATLHSIRKKLARSSDITLRHNQATEKRLADTLHCPDTEDKEGPDGGHAFRAIFTKDDTLEWFDT